MCLTSLLVYRTIIIIFTIQTGNFAVLYFLVEGLKQGESLYYIEFSNTRRVGSRCLGTVIVFTGTSTTHGYLGSFCFSTRQYYMGS